MAQRLTKFAITLLLLIVFKIDAATTIVGTITELTSANSSVKSGDTILLKDGTYQVVSYGITVRTNNITFKSQSGNREKVIISGAGMNGSIEYGFWIASNNVTVRDLTIQNVHYHCIQTDVNNDGLHVINCVLRDANEQLLKIPFSATSPSFSENGVVDSCLFEFTAGVANQNYTGGIDCHYGKNWIIKNNTFKNIRSPANQVAEHAVHFWNSSESTIVEKNVIINCDRGIGFGLGDRGHKGGIIRNNIIYHGVFSGTDNADVGISLESSPGTQVYNNTIFFENAYPNAIEYRFGATTGVTIQNNLTNKAIQLRDGANGTVSSNVINAQKSWFTNTFNGDLHLNTKAVSAINQGIKIDGLITDIDGDLRLDGLVDIGADEFNLTKVNSKKQYGSTISPASNKTANKKIFWIFDSNRPFQFGNFKQSFDLSGKTLQNTRCISEIFIIFNE
jgi:hypothetical protein